MLIARGSVGRETDRIDAWSDLDFFVVAAAGAKRRRLARPDWLAAAHPLAWHVRNTADGFKALMADGVFCEFAVFEPAELEAIPFAPGRVAWKREGVDDTIAAPRRPLPGATTDETWIVGEALACLLVGLGRWRRGEKLSAMRFVQGHALDRLIELDALRTRPPAGDPFSGERRFEARQPAVAAELAALAPGYERTPQAALAMLDALAAPMVERIRARATPRARPRCGRSAPRRTSSGAPDARRVRRQPPGEPPPVGAPRLQQRHHGLDAMAGQAQHHEPRRGRSGAADHGRIVRHRGQVCARGVGQRVAPAAGSPSASTSEPIISAPAASSKLTSFTASQPGCAIDSSGSDSSRAPAASASRACCPAMRPSLRQKRVAPGVVSSAWTPSPSAMSMSRRSPPTKPPGGWTSTWWLTAGPSGYSGCGTRSGLSWRSCATGRPSARR